MKSNLQKVIDRKRKAAEQERTKAEPPRGVCDVMARCSPHLEDPRHLLPFTTMLDRSVEMTVEAVFAAPPQHGKTECIKHAFVLHCMKNQNKDHAYCTFNATRGREVLEGIQQIAFLAGLDPHIAGYDLTLSGNNKIRARGTTTGSLTGQPVTGLLVIDDPIKDRKEAVSPTIREDRWNWFVDVAQTRRHPGSSVIVMMTRWHQDDLSGRVIANMGWPYLRIAAECDSEDDPLGRELGEFLWDHYPASYYIERRVNALNWASMYQGRPKPIGDALFLDATYYDTLPGGGYSTGYGCDLAYTGKTRADWSVIVRGRWVFAEKALYLTGLIRAQAQADRFTERMRAFVVPERGPVLWFCGASELGTAQLIRTKISTFQGVLAAADKYTRALPTAEGLWNQGRLLVPRKAPWARQFVDEVEQFTGMQDPHDDNVDALAALGHLFLKGAARPTEQHDMQKKLAGKFSRTLR